MSRGHKGRVLLIFAAAHFALSILIMPITMGLTADFSAAPDGPGRSVILLVRATQLLHFPVLALALFPREWFPGNWVYVPMALNSMIWAFGISGLIVLSRKFR
jgi:hypothetical protein